MKKYFVTVIALIASLSISKIYGQTENDSIAISLSKPVYLQGDSLELRLYYPNYINKKLKSATAHIWIDHLDTKQRWKFRYPMIEGEVNAALKISEQIPSGNYAISCLIQSGFYRMQGQVIERDKKDTVINYMMRTSTKQMMVDRVKVDGKGFFTMKPMLFQDTASFYFSPVQKPKKNYLAILLKTPVDSAFEPAAIQTAFFSVGKPGEFINKKIDYSLSLDDPEFGSDLPNVTVYTKAKTKVQEYEESYTSGLFKNDNAYIFDGLGNDELAQSQSLAWYLQQKVPGLNVAIDSANNEVFKWREEICSIFIDEFEVMPGEQTMVFPRDIAMIKVFRPPFQYSSTTGFGGAIAIYTKKGKFVDNNGAKFSFILKGYTAFDSVWK
ncbi:MAG: hypothetical protein A2546_11740 [Sphingobacteriia bacterium RIFOXYD2_FULL_35_12]|nr:MAG: hypothetical protein A2472_02490 [Sphingobacteriia bacterium RIFOXYC2_FULL_35_18]OHC89967.1 MAG: hypothetical protein A2546_11740 [Sphingobacteriia bacterium RIFOXYD2_FULL_35_12]